MKVTAVKKLDSGTTVEYEKDNKGTPDRGALKDCRDTSEALDAALDALQPEVARMLGFNRKEYKENLILTGVRVVENAAGEGFIFLAKWPTPAGTVSINTKTMRAPNEEADGPTIMGELTYKRVVKVLEEAESYYRGERVVVQQEMDLDDVAEG